MKGPGLRIELNVQRCWQCPRCGRTVPTGGDTVAQRCTCAPDAWMKLVEPPRRPRPGPSPVGPDAIFLDEVGDEFLESLPGEAPPVDEIEPETSASPAADLQALEDGA